MVRQTRSAGWAEAHLAVARWTRSRTLLGAGIACFLAGAGIAVGALAPMFLGESGTVFSATVAPLTRPAAISTNVMLPGAGSTAVGSAVVIDGPVNGVAFQMEVPAIGYRATVLEGVTAQQLDRGPGHYPDSAWPGQPGNVGVAAHNVYWLSFNRLRAGDQVVIQTRHGRFVYGITGSEVVGPDDRSVLAQSPEHRLTLTTCYPLWAGAYATQRLVFLASQVG